MGCAGAAAYAASKAYLRSFGNALHDELKKQKVFVTTVLPGAVDTAFARTADMERSLVFSVPGGLGGSCGRCNCGRASAVRDIGKPVGFVLGYK